MAALHGQPRSAHGTKHHQRDAARASSALRLAPARLWRRPHRGSRPRRRVLHRQGRAVQKTDEERDPVPDKKLTPGEIRKLKDAGLDPEEVKDDMFPGQGDKNDLYKDKKGNVCIKPKNSEGSSEPTGININDL